MVSILSSQMRQLLLGARSICCLSEHESFEGARIYGGNVA